MKKLPPPQQSYQVTVNQSVRAHSIPTLSTLDTIARPVAVGGQSHRGETDSTWVHHLRLMTNAPLWMLCIANIAVDIDVAQHWSFYIPVYYSGTDYFFAIDNIKFRTFSFQPAVRYKFGNGEDGWFIDAHFGMMYFNLAVAGEYRYQDHDADSPMLGGGIGFGYRLPISKDKRWKFEAGLGIGVYSLHYDRFRNVPNGKLVDTTKDIYYGIDNIFLSFGYSFDIGKKRHAKTVTREVEPVGNTTNR